ncbi:hypothetical protein [Micromonospora coxensis]|uniref:Uncharacterized protein n=1 Tax=Micromonospora coxensis TaxID=356852 RepID=A0A1C5IS42_9ACTN|nr:hypothetical protein [Micromonospora coxensis]SCG61135.1 hypothetical protein GA0070614_3311 [Micromonospora coxensis]
MNSLDERLANGLHSLVDGEPDSTPPVGLLLERGRRARRRRAGVVSGTLAVLALGAIGTVSLVQPATVARPGGVAESAPGIAAPRMKLASAVAASENISYRLRLTTATQWGPGQTYEGAFDPKTATGYVRAPQEDSVMTELLINGTRYIGGEPPLGALPPDKGPEHEKYGRYGQYPGKYDRLSLYGDPDTVLDAAAPDPAALFKALKTANATVRENPDGTLHFAYAMQHKDGSTTTSGDITRDADGRIAKVTLNGTWQSTAKGRLDTGTSTATLELFDYGVEVKVKPPTDVVPAE